MSPCIPQGPMARMSNCIGRLKRAPARLVHMNKQNAGILHMSKQNDRSDVFRDRGQISMELKKFFSEFYNK